MVLKTRIVNGSTWMSWARNRGEESYSDESVIDESGIYVYDSEDLERAGITREGFENLLEREDPEHPEDG